jgi:hypothetical protein
MTRRLTSLAALAVLAVLSCGPVWAATRLNYFGGAKIGPSGLTIDAGNLVCETTAGGTARWTITGGTGVVSSVPTTTTLNAFTIAGTTLTSGNLFRLTGVDATLSGGKYINVYGGTGTTSVWSVAEGGATLLTPNVATINPLYIDGTVTTTGNFLTMKAVDATLAGGLYLNFLGGSGSTNVFSVGESGATTITPNVGTVRGLYVNGTATTSADLVRLLAVDNTLNGGYYVNCLGGAGATPEFTVAEGGVVAAAGAISGTALSATTGKITGSAGVAAAGDSVVYNQRHRVTTAEVNAGHTLVTVPDGVSFRLVGVKVIAYGGAATGLTTLDILDGSTKLVAFAQASLTQSTVLFDGGTGATVLADGASYIALTAGNDVSIGKTGSNLATATGIDVVVSYTLE